MISFSIITVTWQAAGVIQPTLDSVLAQDFPDVVLNVSGVRVCGQRVVVGYKEVTIVVVLQSHKIPQRTKIVAEV